jgi:hypothetical protein
MEALEPRPWDPPRRCTGTNRRGERCWRHSVPGTVPPICVSHGAAAPQVLKSAKQRLLAGADLAIDYLLNLLTPRPPCEHCGRSDADRDPVVVRACQLVLDRSGFHPSLTVQHVAPPQNVYTSLTEDEVIEQLQAKVERAQQQLASLRAKREMRLLPLPSSVEEGFLVPEIDEQPYGDAPQGDEPYEVTPPENLREKVDKVSTLKTEHDGE